MASAVVASTDVEVVGERRDDLKPASAFGEDVVRQPRHKGEPSAAET